MIGIGFWNVHKNLKIDGIMLYPVTFVIEEGIAEEIDRPEFYLAKDEEELLEILEKILNSERITKVVNNLLKLNKE